MSPSATPDYFVTPELLRSTRRFAALDRLDRYHKGTQYDGRPDWYTGVGQNGGDPVPLRERKPVVIYPLPRAACNQATRFAFGEGRFPTIEVAKADADALAPGLAVSEAEAATLTSYLTAAIEAAQLKSVLRTLLRHGLAQRTAVAVVAVRRGSFTVDMPRAADCFPEFQDGDTSAPVVRMVWCYPFEKAVQRGQAICYETHLFRRDFTAEEVVAYEDAPLLTGQAVQWTRDEEATVAHGLGFCPVLWIRNLPEADGGEVDGTALFDGLEDELDELNFALSQRARGIHYFGSPQAYETGVGEDERPGAMGRTSRSAVGPSASFRIAGGAGKARKTAPDQIWSYQAPDAKVAVMETTGKAFEVSSAHVLDIRARILEAIDVVLIDPMTVAGKGDLSGKAWALMYAPLLALVDELRDCWWSSALAPLLSMILRITAVLGGRGIFLPRAGDVAAICSRFFLAHAEGKQWVPPRMVPSWGAYFSPSSKEVGELVDATVKAKDGGLIAAGTAARAVAPYFGVTDAAAEAEEAEGVPLAEAEGRLAIDSEPGPSSTPTPETP